VHQIFKYLNSPYNAIIQAYLTKDWATASDLTYTWTFEDGTSQTTTEPTVYKCFENTGNSQINVAVNVEVSNGSQTINSDAITIGVAPGSSCNGEEPIEEEVAELNGGVWLGTNNWWGVSPYDATIQANVNGDWASASGLTYTWTFGDGTSQTTTEPTVSKCFENTGNSQMGVTIVVEVSIGNQSIDSQPITINIAPGTSCIAPRNSNNVTNSIRIYPNPFTHQFTLETKAAEGQIRIVDMTGRILLEQTVEGETTTINTKGLKAGYYLVEVENNGVTETQKIIKH